MEHDKAVKLLENKCREFGCWHYIAKGYTVCTCHIHGVCATIDTTIRSGMEEALLFLEDESRNPK